MILKEIKSTSPTVGNTVMPANSPLTKIATPQQRGGFEEVASRVTEAVTGLPGQLREDFRQGLETATKSGTPAGSIERIPSAVAGAAKTVYRAGGDIIGAALSPITEPIGVAIEGYGQALPAVKQIVSEAIDMGGEGLATLLDKIPGYSELILNSPEAEKDVIRGLNWLSVLGGRSKKVKEAIKGGELPPAGPGGGAPPGGGGGGILGMATRAIEKGKQIVEPLRNPTEILSDTKKYIQAKNVPENFESSVKRLGEKTGVDPLAKYNEFFDQEMRFKTDIKQDMAAGVVGERIGDAYNKVANMRRQAGKTMAEEIKKVGKTKLDLENPFIKLEEQLNESGLRYNAQNKKTYSR